MLPKLKEGQSVFLEITNPAHGGSGWEFGSCLWSPVKDRGGSEAWKIMKEVQVGDIIIHLLKSDEGYVWAGVSMVVTPLIQTIDEPPRPERWTNMSPYQRINLGQFNNLISPPTIGSFFREYNSSLREILHENKEGMFYVEYPTGGDLRVSQKYFAKVPPVLYDLFDDFSESLNFIVQFRNENSQVPTVNEPPYPDYTSPGRIEVITSRIVRDTALVRGIKSNFNWKCQVCGKRILLENSKYYAEGHHLKPLGGEYNGPDVKENIIILCPYHHAEFDYGSIAINPVTKKIIHSDPNNNYNDKDLVYERTDINDEFIRFHYDKIFWGEKLIDKTLNQ
ncbi:hypothetical protein HOE37_03365 [Candidatus Woesearchaeota archaeon]|jgi:hypothetical protein|nr:hypothetical protein [Candidatus Woesearchaeota archaeon]MBT4336619.1 hypothetical protein [Candidatus Woesearchaeota archaeon]MBT4469632.1 hypothetical protein [Candidatus Woesearchaeota archaeon]MBT6743994.1 hypothetical protein [Candidatus Woesearchaeota archaeon]